METIIQVKFICPECRKYKKEKRFGCPNKKLNRETEKKLHKSGFICCECFKRVGFWRAEQLLNA